MIDEKACRRENFDEANSVWVRLADGQDFAFPKPWLQIHAAFKGGRAVDSYPVLTYGPELDDLIGAISECKDTSAILIGGASLGGYLLTRNYDLTDEQLDELFAIRVGDPDSREWIKKVMEIATGGAGSRSFRDGNG